MEIKLINVRSRNGKRLLRMIMKMFIFLMCTTVFCLNTKNSFSQEKIMIKKDQLVTVNHVFKIIQKQTDFNFVYPRNAFKDMPKVQLNKGEIEVEELLKKSLSNNNLSFELGEDNNILIKKNVVISDIVKLQEVVVSGTITDESGQPLPGANIIEKGTNNGAKSDFDGNYSIKASKGNVLVISFIGFITQEIVVGDDSLINIKLKEETEKLDEIVVVAYGVQKKSHLTAAVDQIDSKSIENRPLRTLADALSGLSPGLNVRTPSGAPEATPNLNIRGFTGFGTSGQPLILVDGVERSIGDVNPNDVGTISVLKDGAATAIYGSRAPFGIVLITTKRGKKGEGPQITFSSNLRYGKPSNTPEFHESYDWMGYVNEARRNVRDGNSPRFRDITVERARAFATGDFNNPVFDGLDPEHVRFGLYASSSSVWAGNTGVFANNDPYKTALKNSVPSSEYNLGISGGGEKSSYYVGLGHNESVGIFTGEGDFKDRNSILINLDTEVNDWLDLSFKTNYVRTFEQGPNYRGQGRNYNGIWGSISQVYPSQPEFNPDGSYYRFSLVPQFSGEGGNETVLRNDLTLTTGGTIKLAKGWKIDGTYTWRNNANDVDRTTFVLKQTLPNGTVVNNQRTSNTSGIITRKRNTDYHTIDLHTSYKYSVNKHNFFVLAVYQEEETAYSELRGDAFNFITEDVPTISTASSEGIRVDDRLYEWATRGYFGRFSYDYNGKYLLEFNFRRDATSRFRKDNRWGNFPSVSAGWNVAKEKFWKLDRKYVSSLKLRGSWSTSGNANVQNGNFYLFYPGISTQVSNSTIIDGGLVSTANPPNLVSDQITWAKPRTIDFGVDILALNNRLSFTYDWYQRTVEDQFGPATALPETLGTAVPQSNNATSETRGWEFKITWKDEAFKIAEKPLNYNVRFSMNDYIGYVVDYEDNGTGARSGQWIKGETFGQNYFYSSNGIVQNVDDIKANVRQGGGWYYPGDLAIKDLNGDGLINRGQGGTWFAQGDMVKSGFNYPRKAYGISLGIDWNGFDFSAQLDGVGEWTTYSSSRYIWGNDGGNFNGPFFKETTDLGFWRPDNTNAFFPRNVQNRKNSGRSNDQYQLDLAHLRIKNIKLGYTLPKEVVDMIKLDGIYFYLSAENLGFIYNNAYVDYDPELLRARAGSGYPPQSILSFGFNVKF